MKFLPIKSSTINTIMFLLVSFRVFAFTSFRTHVNKKALFTQTATITTNQQLSTLSGEVVHFKHGSISQTTTAVTTTYHTHSSPPNYSYPHICRSYHTSTELNMGKPKSGNIVDSYQTVSVNCKKCKTRLFRYKKKNGTKSNLVKCYVERISEDCVGLIAEKKKKNDESNENEIDNSVSCGDEDWICPNCQTKFGRNSMIHGRPAIKLVGGKIQMTKK